MSSDSRFALISYASDGESNAVRLCGTDSRFAHLILTYRMEFRSSFQEIHLLDITTHQIVRRYSGHSHSRNVIQGCFGGTKEDLIVSGSEGASRISSRPSTRSLMGVSRGYFKPVHTTYIACFTPFLKPHLPSRRFPYPLNGRRPCQLALDLNTKPESHSRGRQTGKYMSGIAIRAHFLTSSKVMEKAL